MLEWLYCSHVVLTMCFYLTAVGKCNLYDMYLFILNIYVNYVFILRYLLQSARDV